LLYFYTPKVLGVKEVMKKIVALILLILPSLAFSATEDNLKITEIGAWAEGNSILYIRSNRSIGPSSCNSNFVKVYLGNDTDSVNKLNSKSLIRSLALTALTAKLNVKVNVLDSCLHNSPTINQLYVKA
jgi:hypothetical protein